MHPSAIRRCSSVLILLVAMGVADNSLATSVGFVTKWGALGTAPGQLNGPEQIAVGSDGNIYVAENRNCRIQVFTSVGTFVRMWGTQGDGDGQFGMGGLVGVAVGPDGSVYTAERTPNCCIQKFTPDGTFISKWGCRFGSCPNELDATSGIAAGTDGFVYVSDFNGRIQKFTGEGVYVKTWGDIGPDECTTGEGPTVMPGFVQWTPDGRLLAAEDVNHKVNAYTGDGALVRSWGCCILGPGGVSDDGNGHVYAVEGYHDFVQVYSQDGQFITQFGSTGDGDGQFHFPTGLAADASGFVYVSDLGNNRIQKFRLDAATATKSSTWGRVRILYR